MNSTLFSKLTICDLDLPEWGIDALRNCFVLDCRNNVELFYSKADGCNPYGVVASAISPWESCFQYYGSKLNERGVDEAGVLVVRHKISAGDRRIWEPIIGENARKVSFTQTSQMFHRRGDEIRNNSPIISFLDDRGCICVDRYLYDGRDSSNNNPTNSRGRYSRIILLSHFMFQLANCRNIVAEDEGEIGGRGGRERQQMRGFKIRYHILKIKNSSRKKREADCDIATGVAKHIRRGHFKNYTGETKKNLLFGKIQAVVWVPDHVCGDIKHGVVGKEYALADN